MIGSNICVWDDYGQTRAFPAETVEDILQIINRIILVTSSWGIDQEHEELRRVYTRFYADIGKLRRFVRGWVDRVGKGHETFEQFEFSTIQRA